MVPSPLYSTSMGPGQMYCTIDGIGCNLGCRLDLFPQVIHWGYKESLREVDAAISTAGSGMGDDMLGDQHEKYLSAHWVIM
jgi:hypothetical protein